MTVGCDETTVWRNVWQPIHASHPAIPRSYSVVSNFPSSRLFLALLDFSAELLSWCRRPSVCPSVNSGFLETVTWIQAKFCAQLPQSPCPPYPQSIFFFFQNFQFSKFYDFFLISLTSVTVNMRANISKRYSYNLGRSRVLKILKLETISPERFFLFSKFSIFKFLRFFFVFVNQCYC